MPLIPAKKICLIRTSAIGDTVHALGLVNALKKGYPDAHLTWVLQSIPYEMVMHQPGIDRFITFDRKGGFQDWRNLRQRLRKDHFDLAIIPQASSKTSMITLFTRAGIRLGFDFKRSREFHWIVTNRHIEPRPMRHVQDQFFEFVEHLGITDYPVEWNFHFTDEERQWQQFFFDSIDRPVVGFVVASAHPEKDWSPAGYAEVMDHVDSRLNLQPMIIGGPSAGERQIAEQIADRCRCTPVFALEKPIRRTMLQLDGSRLIVSPDTGPLHIAVALNIPTVGLYGYSDPRRCGPFRKFHDLLIDKYKEPDMPSPPITRKVKSGRMQRITTAEVIGKIELGLKIYPDRRKRD